MKYILVGLAVCLVGLVSLNLLSITEDKRDSIFTTVYGTDDIIEQVADKLETEPENITFELGDGGELFYHTPTGTYAAKADGSKIEYLLEVNK